MGRVRSTTVNREHGKDLSPAMIRALQLAADGYDVSSTASDCGVSVHTIKKHRLSAMYRLGADNMIHAVAMAMRRGVVK